MNRLHTVNQCLYMKEFIFTMFTFVAFLFLLSDYFFLIKQGDHRYCKEQETTVYEL